jgi:hypothetical protein
MFGQLWDLLGGWREVRSSGGFSYQVSRSGRRRVVPIDGYRNRTVPDAGWVATGTFAEDGIRRQFRNFRYRPAPGARRRERLSRVEFGIGR